MKMKRISNCDEAAGFCDKEMAKAGLLSYLSRSNND